MEKHRPHSGGILKETGRWYDNFDMDLINIGGSKYMYSNLQKRSETVRVIKKCKYIVLILTPYRFM